jgi:hypothetical protein
MKTVTNPSWPVVSSSDPGVSAVTNATVYDPSVGN